MKRLGVLVPSLLACACAAHTRADPNAPKLLETPPKAGPNVIGFLRGPGDTVFLDMGDVRPVGVVPGTFSLAYPPPLRSAGIEGEVIAQFDVDEKGHADLSSFNVISATDRMFVTSVREALKRARFFPAEVNGKAVRQVVRQPFNFRLAP